jgi:polysaccharide pyruvyl transferase WcaK-like protein
VLAKLRGCKLLFISVGAGPIYGRLSKFFVKSALALADFRSYRDERSMRYLENIGFAPTSDQVYPDLVFSLPQAVIPYENKFEKSKCVVGLGLMEYAGRYSVANPSPTTYRNYLENLVILTSWLLTRGYDVRLLIGDTCDKAVVEDFRRLLNGHLSIHDSGRIIDEPAASVEQLLSQLASTDMVVATRFHNVLLALLLHKPVMSISFHHKCASLMSQMGLSEYCQDINDLKADRLIEQFCRLEKNAGSLGPMIRQKVEGCRKALDEQYHLILQGLEAR